MNNDTIVDIENLSKRYTLSHTSGNIVTPNYAALREVITGGIQSGLRRVSSLLLPKRDGEPQVTRREDFWALRDVSLTIRPGERVGIIGRNGAGKTTLLKLLSRITSPTTGRIHLKGRVASLLEVGTGFHPELTGRENIYLNGAVMGMIRSDIKKRFDAIVDFAEVERFLDTPIKRYSSGMKVRLAFAVASHLDPEILLVDEVLAVGDAKFQQKCLGKMQGVATTQGRTIFFVSHNMSAIRRLCDRCLLMDQGRLVADGPTDDTVKTYLSAILRNVGEKKWPVSPGLRDQQRFVPMRARMKNAGGRVSDNFSCTEEFTVEFDFCLPAAVDNLRIGVKLYTALGEWICLSYDEDDPDTYVPSVTPAGTYRRVFHVPPHFLNEGQYSVALYGSTAYGQMWSELDSLTFTTQINNGVGSHWSSEEKRDGVIRPLFKWDKMQL